MPQCTLRALTVLQAQRVSRVVVFAGVARPENCTHGLLKAQEPSGLHAHTGSRTSDAAPLEVLLGTVPDE